MKITFKNVLMVLITLVITYQNEISAQTNWEKYPNNPIIIQGGQGSWFDEGFPFVYLMSAGNEVFMWFTASDQAHDRIGFATSEDGLTFNFHTDPVLEPSAGGQNNFDSEGVFGANVLFDGTIYRMWYNGYNTQPYYAGQIRAGLATSDDGINWERYSDNPVLETGEPGSWDDTWAYVNTVLLEGGIYKMWYTGFDGITCAIGYATSNDGIVWEKFENNPVLSGLPGEWDESNIQNARVISENGMYKMWYNGNSSSNPNYDIGYATSEDEVSWKKFDGNPILITGEPGSFDSQWCWSPLVFSDEGDYYMWYSGYNGNNWCIGFATDLESTGFTTKHDSNEKNEVLTVYPNPVKGESLVRYKIETPGRVNISLSDIHGKELMILFDEYMHPGNFTLPINLRGLPSGILLCSLKQNDQVFYTKILVVK